MNNIQILVTGEAKSGKTTIAEFIAKCLNQIGIEATVEDKVGLIVSDEAAAEREQKAEDTFQDRLKTVVQSEKPARVEIRTDTLKRIML